MTWAAARRARPRRCGWRVTGRPGPVSRRGRRPRTGRPPAPRAGPTSGWPAAAARSSSRAGAAAGLAGGPGPGDSWQQRWLASGAETAGTSWRQLPARWPARPALRGHAQGRRAGAGAGHRDLPDIVRPSLAWLVAARLRRRAGPRHGRIPRSSGFARLQALCATRRPAAADSPHSHAAPGRGHPGRQGRRCSPASSSATSWSCWTPRPTCTAPPEPRRRLLPAAARDGDLRPRSAGPAAGTAHRGPAHPRRDDRPAPPHLPAHPGPAGRLPERTPARDRLRQPGTASPPAGHVLGRPGSSPSRHRQPAPDCRGRRRVETAPAHQAEDHHLRRPAQDRDRRRADLPPRVPHPGPGLLPRPGPVGRRGPGPVGTLGGALPGRPGRDHPGQGPAAPQVPDGRPDPRAAPGPARPDPLRRPAARRHASAPAAPPAPPGPATPSPPRAA